MKFLETSKPLSAEDIAEIENELMLNFPGDFKQHYLKYNGGYPENDEYHWPNGDITTINTFSSIKYSGFSSVNDNYISLVLAEKYLPERIVPFATDDGGNFFCISARQKDYGNVYYCNNDHYDVADKKAPLILIEKDFSSFLNNLKISV